MYAGYVDLECYYNEYGGMIIPEEELNSRLREASRHIDTLTFNRIADGGFENLTDFQKNVIKEVVCRQAEFEFENEDVLQSVISGYSINGVSMQIASGWNVFTDSGIAMRRDVYALLEQTGLCCRILGV